jgi:hypothetical protein
MNKEKLLQELVEKLTSASGPNLEAVVLYGSAAGEEFHESYSDLNVLCVLKRLDGSEMERVSSASRWWVKKGHPAPLLFGRDELQAMAGVFPIEFLDIKSKRKLLYGEDLFASFEVPMKLYRSAVERELVVNIVRLRQGSLAAGLKAKNLMRLMTASASSFMTLFRNALLVLGEQPPKSSREVVDRLAARLGFDASPFHVIWDVRERKRKEKSVDVRSVWVAYVENAQRAADALRQESAPPGQQSS